MLRKVLRLPQPYAVLDTKEGDDPQWCCVEALPGLKVPTLIIWKRFDPYFPVSQAYQARELIPDARLEVIPGYGHAPHVQDREAFQRILKDFLHGG